MTKLISYLIEALGWARIVASPLLLSLGLGFLIYMCHPSAETLICAAFVVALGLLVGVLWATRVWKKQGTISFLSKTSHTPDFDNSKEQK